jgi:hypothetical protein
MKALLLVVLTFTAGFLSSRAEDTRNPAAAYAAMLLVIDLVAIGILCASGVFK